MIKIHVRFFFEQHTFNEYINNNNIYFYEFISIAKNYKLVLKKIINMLRIDYDFFIQTIDLIKNLKLQNIILYIIMNII